MGTFNKWLGLVILFLSSGIFAMENTVDESKAPPEEDKNTGVYTQSVVQKSCEGANKSYDDAVKLAEKSKNPVILHIIEKDNANSWEAIIDIALKKGGFTSPDLLWVLQEYAYPSMLSDEEARNVFNLMIINPLKDRSASILALLTDTNIAVPASLLGSYSYFREERRNVLAEMIERSYLKAFKEILPLLSMNPIENDVAITREENTGEKKGYFFDYQFKAASYNLVDWLLRDNYASLTKANMHYVIAAKHMIERRLDDEICGVDVNYPIFNLTSTLWKRELIDEELFKKVAGRYKYVPTEKK